MEISWQAFTQTPAYNQIYYGFNFTVILIIYAIVFSLIGFFMFFWMRYKHPVVVFQKVGLTYHIKRRKAWLKNNLGHTEMYLQRWFQKGEKVLPPRDDQWFPAGGSKKLLLLRQEGNTYYPIEIDESGDTKLRYDEYDVKTFYLAESKRMIDKYKRQTFLDKYGNLIAMGVFVLVLFIIFMIMFQRIEQLINVVDGMGKTFIQTIKTGNPPGA